MTDNYSDRPNYLPGSETLKTGERLTIECVIAPDAERETQIRPFLAHKPPHYLGHIESAFAGQCDDLETRFYIGLLDGEMVGNIMTAETAGIGLFGHVHTREDQRRKGICDAIMKHQMEDFRRRGGHVLLLGTGYQSPAYRIYEKHGFRDWKIGRHGLMRYDAEPEEVFLSRFFASAKVTPAPARWKHWPLVALLATLLHPPYLRSLALNLWGVGMLEGPYCQFLHSYRSRPEVRAGVLESETGAVSAFASCIPDGRWPGMHLLDLFAHPGVPVKDLISLLESLQLPAERIQSYADPHDMKKREALEKLGFRHAVTLPEQYRTDDSWHDILLYSRPLPS